MTTLLRDSGWKAFTANESGFGGSYCSSSDSGTPRLSGNNSEFSKTYPDLLGLTARASSFPVCETHSAFKYIGESTNEDKSFPQIQEAASVCFKGHHAAKDGFITGGLTAEAIASFRSRLGKLFQHTVTIFGRKLIVRTVQAGECSSVRRLSFV